MGLFDAELTFSNKQISDLIKAQLMAGSLKKEIDAILLFETPRNEAH